MPNKKNTASFEQSLNELESLVQKMESGELSLEDSLIAFEQGVKLTRACRDELLVAEQTVQKLLESGDAVESYPFDAALEENNDAI